LSWYYLDVNIFLWGDIMDKGYLVTKSNKLICANYDLSLQEQKIILTLASMVQPQDTELKEYEFKIKDFIALLGLKDQSKYTEVRKITKELKKKVFEIKEGTDIVQVSWLGGVRYKTKEGIVILRLDPDLKPYMLQLKELYTSYRLENVLSLKSKYSIRLYEILKSNLYKKEVHIELEELKKMVGAKEKSYDVYQNFKNKVIVKAQEELKLKTDTYFDFEEVKTSRKVTSLKFTVKSNVKIKSKAKDEVAATILIDEEIGTYLDDNIKELIEYMKEHKLLPMQVAQLYELANNDKKLLKEVYEYCIPRADTNLFGYMKNTLKAGYVAPIKSKKIDKFNDFEQRQYNFDDLEKKLLGWD
jgi:plasmid replication initiation protein